MRPVIAVTLLLSMSTATYAADVYLPIGFAVGAVDLSALAEIPPGAFSSDEDLARVVAGVGYEFTKQLSVEALYLSKVENQTNTNEPSGFRTRTIAHDAIQIAALSFLPISEKLSVFIRISANFVNADYASKLNYVQESAISESNIATGFGIGLQAWTSETIGVRLGLERIQISDAAGISEADFDVDQLSLSLINKF